MTMVPCPANCGRQQREGQFLCLPCWTGLPQKHKSSIRRAWEDLRTIDQARSQVDYLRAMRAYRLARDDAIGYLSAVPTQAGKPDEDAGVTSAE